MAPFFQFAAATMTMTTKRKRVLKKKICNIGRGVG
jgi:hypothetical protein